MKEQSNSSKVFRGVSSQTVVTFTLGVVEIISFSIMSRLLTKEDFGYYAAVSAIVAIFSCFSDAGIGSAIIQRKNPTKHYIDNAFTLSLIFGAVVSTLLFVTSGVLARQVTDESMIFPLQLMSITLLLNCIYSVNISIMYRRLQFLKVGLINLVSLVITIVVAVVLAIKGYGYYAIIAKSVLYSLISMCLSFFYANTRYSLALDRKTFRQIFGFSGWLMASGLFRNIAHDVDKLLMPRLLSVVSLGAYNRPKDFIGQISSKIIGIFDSALFPILSGIQDDNRKIERAFLESLYYINILGMLLTMSFIINSELLIRIFFGDEWMDLKIVTVLLSFLLLFNIDGRLADCFLRSLGMTKQQFYFRIVETVASVIGVLVGAFWDILGVAIGVVLTNMLLKLAKIFYMSFKIKVPFLSTLRQILVAWKFSVVIVPICVMINFILPHTIIGNLLLLTVYLSIIVVLFLFFPSIVGEHYKNNGYVVVVRYISTIKVKILSK